MGRDEWGGERLGVEGRVGRGGGVIRENIGGESGWVIDRCVSRRGRGTGGERRTVRRRKKEDSAMISFSLCYSMRP